MWYVNVTNELLADSDANSFILTMWYVNPAILIETCFVSNKADTDKYKSNREKIAKLIAEGIANQTITENNTSNTSSTNKLYAVCTGAYNYDNAKKMQQELINKGYKDTYLIPR